MLGRKVGAGGVISRNHCLLGTEALGYGEGGILILLKELVLAADIVLET